MKHRSLTLFVFLTTHHFCVQAGILHVTVDDEANNPIHDAVVIASPTLTPPLIKKSAKPFVIDQVDKEFIRHVTAIPVGTSVLFPNKDDIRHHVYSFSASKPFELPLYTGTPTAPVLFDKAGVVKLGCNIHDWMVAYIYVAESPYFSISDQQGSVQITDLPAGEYNVRVWHPRMLLKEETTQRRVTIDNVKATNINWQLTLKPELRPRRAPLPMQQGY